MAKDKEFRLSPKERVVLRLLTAGDKLYGLDMVNRSPQLKRGTVYVLLSRLTDKGFVASKLSDEKSGGPARRVYNITALGRRALIANEAASSIMSGNLEWVGGARWTSMKRWLKSRKCWNEIL